MPFKKQKAIRSNKKDAIYALMTDLGLYTYTGVGLSALVVSTIRAFHKTISMPPRKSFLCYLNKNYGSFHFFLKYFLFLQEILNFTA